MSLSTSPRPRSGRAPAAVCARLGAIALAILAGGCAAERASAPSWVNGPVAAATDQASPPLRLAQSASHARAASAIRVEIEDDGLPAQLAPRHRSPVADDPTEPWSPNYGSAVPAFDHRRLAEKIDAAEEPRRFSAHPPHARPFDADDVIRRAIAEHEMRRRD